MDCWQGKKPYRKQGEEEEGLKVFSSFFFFRGYSINYGKAERIKEKGKY